LELDLTDWTTCKILTKKERNSFQEQRKKRQGTEAHYFTDEQLITMLFDLWIAGQDTTSNTLGRLLGAFSW
jgi:cytochrome P450